MSIAPGSTWGGPIALIAAAGLAAAYLYSALIPFDQQWDGWSLVASGESFCWLPYQDRDEEQIWERFSLSDAVMNVAVGVPLGWLVLVGFRRIVPVWLALPGAVLLTAVTAVGMEFLQRFTPSRVSTMTDVANITLGGFLGAMAAMLLAGGLWRLLTGRVFPYLLADRARLCLAMLLAFLAVRSFFPDSLAWSLSDFKETVAQANVIPGEIPHRHLFAQLQSLGLKVGDDDYALKRTWENLTPVQYGFSTTGHLFLYGLIGACLMRVRGRPRLMACLSTGLAVGLIGILVEVTQVFFPSQCVDINAALSALVGGLLGAVVMFALANRPVTLSVSCLAAVLAYIATQYLRPGRSTSQGDWWGFDPKALIPLYYYQRGSHRLEIFLDMFEGLALFLPLGWLAAEWATRQQLTTTKKYWIAAVATAAVALGFEVLQHSVARTPSIDDVLWATIGGLLGCWIHSLVISQVGWALPTENC